MILSLVQDHSFQQITIECLLCVHICASHMQKDNKLDLDSLLVFAPYLAASMIFVPDTHFHVRSLPLLDMAGPLAHGQFLLGFTVSSQPLPLHLTGQGQRLYLQLPDSALIPGQHVFPCCAFCLDCPPFFQILAPSLSLYQAKKGSSTQLGQGPCSGIPSYPGLTFLHNPSFKVLFCLQRKRGSIPGGGVRPTALART